jgi:Na+-driven multidrug efflux pump
MAAAIVTGIMITGGLGLLLWGEEIAGIFTKEPELIRTTAVFLRIAVTGYLVLGFNNVLAQSISSAGDTLPPMIFNIGMMWMIQLPLAWALPEFTGLGVMGVRWAIVIGLYGAAAAFIVYFKMGRWKTKRV